MRLTTGAELDQAILQQRYCYILCYIYIFFKSVALSAGAVLPFPWWGTLSRQHASFPSKCLTNALAHFTRDGRLRRRTLVFSVPICTQTDGVRSVGAALAAPRGGGGGWWLSTHTSPNNFLNTQHCCWRTPTKTGLQVWCAAGLDPLICSSEGARAARGPCSDEALVLAVKWSICRYVCLGSLSLILSSSPQTGESTSFTQASKTPFFPSHTTWLPRRSRLSLWIQPNRLWWHHGVSHESAAFSRDSDTCAPSYYRKRERTQSCLPSGPH